MSTFDFSNPPSSAQLDYADSLVDRLRRAQNAAASRFAREVEQCDSKTEMSALITRMRALLDDIRNSDRGLG